jgi:hypothetical protein
VVAGHPQTPALVGRTIVGLGDDGQQVPAGTTWHYRFGIATLNDHRLGNELLEDLVRAYNLDGGTGGYPIEMRVGTARGAEFFFDAEAENNEAAFRLGPRDLPCDLAIRVRGVEDNGCAAVYGAGRKFFRFVAVVGDTAFFQEPIQPAAEMWVGNALVCGDKRLRLTLVIDGQSPGKPPLVEIHNPTREPVGTRVWSPPHTPLLAGLEGQVEIPAGESRFFRIVGRQLQAEPQPKPK